MTCDEFERTLDAYLASALTETEALALEQHAAACAMCEARLDSVSRLSVSTSAPALPPGLRDATLSAVARRRQQKRTNRWLGAVVALAAVVILAVSIREFGTSRGAAMPANAAPGDAASLVRVSDPDRFAAEHSSTEFAALDAAARELEAALSRTPDDNELRAFLATVQARRDELSRRVKAAHS